MVERITVSYSELSTFRDCPLKHRLAYVDLWTTDPREGSPLARGSLWHAVMEAHYLVLAKTSGESREFKKVALEALAEAADAVSVVLTNHSGSDEDVDLILWMYEGYVAMYGADPDWDILAVEVAGTSPLLNHNGRKSRFDLKYKADLVVRERSTRKIAVVDHKSAANFSRPTEIDLDDQFGLYQWAFQRERDQQVFRVWRSDARTQRNKGPMKLEDRFRRVPTYRTPQELTNLALDAFDAATAAYRTNARPYSAPNPQQCGWKCQFMEPHILARKGVSSIPTIMRDFGFHQRPVKHQEYTKQEGQD